MRLMRLVGLRRLDWIAVMVVWNPVTACTKDTKGLDSGLVIIRAEYLAKASTCAFGNEVAGGPNVEIAAEAMPNASDMSSYACWYS